MAGSSRTGGGAAGVDTSTLDAALAACATTGASVDGVEGARGAGRVGWSAAWNARKAAMPPISASGTKSRGRTVRARSAVGYDPRRSADGTRGKRVHELHGLAVRAGQTAD